MKIADSIVKTMFFLLFKEDILHRPSKYIFSSKVSISSLKIEFNIGEFKI